MATRFKFSRFMLACLVLAGLTSAAKAASPAPKVVFIGDSITYAWPFPANSNWINKGLPGISPWEGQTADTVLARFESDVVSLHPAVVHIMVGTNDEGLDDDANHAGVPTGFLNALGAIVKEAQAANIKVILGTDFGASNLNAVMLGYAASKSIPVVNYADMLCQCVSVSLVNTNGVIGGNGGGIYYQSGSVQPVPLIVSPPNPSGSLQTALGNIPSAAGYALMTQMVEVAIDSVMNVKLTSGWLQNIEFPWEDSVPSANVNTVPGNAVVQFTPIGVFSDGSQHPVLNATIDGASGTWTSSNPQVMHISQTGLGLSLAAGATTIRYTPANGAKFSSWVMNVVDGGVPVD